MIKFPKNNPSPGRVRIKTTIKSEFHPYCLTTLQYRLRAPQSMLFFVMSNLHQSIIWIWENGIFLFCLEMFYKMFMPSSFFSRFLQSQQCFPDFSQLWIKYLVTYIPSSATKTANLWLLLHDQNRWRLFRITPPTRWDLRSINSDAKPMIQIKF